MGPGGFQPPIIPLTKRILYAVELRPRSNSFLLFPFHCGFNFRLQFDVIFFVIWSNQWHSDNDCILRCCNRRWTWFDPHISRLSIPKGSLLLNITLLYKSVENGMNGGHHVAVLARVVAKLFEPFLHISWCHRFPRCLECLPNRISQTEYILFHELFTECVREGRN